MPSCYLSRAAIAACAFAVPLGASAQIVPAPPAPEGNATSFTIFLRAAPVGTEQVSVTRIADGWTITSTGRMAPPIDVVARRIQARYTADWRPVEFTFDGTVRGEAQHIHTTIEDATAHSEIAVAAKNGQKNDRIDPAALLLSTTSFFGPYEALAVRVRGAAPGTEIPAYAEGPMVPFTIKVGDSAPEQIQTTARLVSTRRTHLVMELPPLALDADLWTDDAGRMVRFSVLAQSLDVVREDIAAVSSRTVTISRPNDERITIPANGFTLAGTLSRPAASTAARLPAVVLVGGSGPTDRDGIAFGIPILGELAGALADAGFMVVRYDKRGVGQSGGRAESATLADYAEDARAAVKWLGDRRDVDPKRIALVGHSEGGLVSLIAAGKDRKIAAVVLVATPGMPGSDVVLAQQRRLLDRMKLSPEERQAKIAAQTQINQAVITGKDLDKLPAAVRRSVDNPEFQSILTSDPAKLMKDVRQPMLIVQGLLDAQVDAQNADLLATLAKQRKNAPPVEVAKLPDVNHLLVPATTGEFDEYASLPDKHVAAPVKEAIATWLQKTLSATR
jgi:pimeloyl-ACP methyl ester carboxylesterase